MPAQDMPRARARLTWTASIRSTSRRSAALAVNARIGSSSPAANVSSANLFTSTLST